YPLGYIVPGSASDEEYAVRLTALGELPEQKAQVLLVLAKNGLDQQARFALRLPHMVRTFPPARKSSAEQLADDIRAAGGQVETVRQRQWTGFYFQQALGFTMESAATFPYFRLVPNSPHLWECLRNSLILAVTTTLATTLLCLPLAYWFTRFAFP